MFARKRNIELDPAGNVIEDATSTNMTLQPQEGDGVVVVGKGTKIVGQIGHCARLEIQGTVEGTVVADTILIREGGIVTGELQAAHAEIHGRFEGVLRVKDDLDVCATGYVRGELSYGRLSVAKGGHISGDINAATADLVAVETVPAVQADRVNGHAMLSMMSGPSETFAVR
jgi:cytoskeletal protein CcmA (bactofilin family)